MNRDYFWTIGVYKDMVVALGPGVLARGRLRQVAVPTLGPTGIWCLLIGIGIVAGLLLRRQYTAG